MDQLNDDSLMPFGQYKGRKLVDIPASYFHWLWCSKKLNHDHMRDPVSDYMKRNLHVLKLEHPDGIWQ